MTDSAAGVERPRRSVHSVSVATFPTRPHVLGVDDGPFEKFSPGAEAPLVGVMMEGADLVEAVAHPVRIGGHEDGRPDLELVLDQRPEEG